MEGSDIYDFEVVDEWSEENDSEEDISPQEKSLNSTKDKNCKNKPTEGEIDAFLEDVKELVTCETSGLKDDIKSYKSKEPKDINSSGNVLSPTESITVQINSPNGSRSVNLSNDTLINPLTNFHSPSDASSQSSRSKVSYKPGGALVKTIFHESTCSINDNSSSYFTKQQLSTTSASLITNSFVQNEEFGDGFSDNIKKDGNNWRSSNSPEVEAIYRHKRDSYKKIFEKRGESFSRERCNSRKEVFSEQRGREKRQREERARGRSRSRSRPRFMRHHNSPHRGRLELSPSPPPKLYHPRDGERLGGQRRTGIDGQHYYSNPRTGHLPGYPQNVSYPVSTPPYLNAPSMEATGVGMGYKMKQGYVPYPPAVTYPMQQTQEQTGYSHAYQPYQLMGDPLSSPWSAPPPAYPQPQAYPFPENKSAEGGYYNHSSTSQPRPQAQTLPNRSAQWNSYSGLDVDKSLLRNRSRSNSPRSPKPHKKKLKKHSSSPGPSNSRNDRKHKSTLDFFYKDFYSSDVPKKPKMIIDPNRIPTPPPPPILSNRDNKPHILGKSNKLPAKSLTEMIDKESVSLSCLLEAVMETSGQGKSQVSNPKVKEEILSHCENKIRQLYKRRQAGMGAFMPDIVEKRLLSVCYSPLVRFHPHLSFNDGAEEQNWRCPEVEVPPVALVDPVLVPVETPAQTPAPIGTLVSGWDQPSPKLVPDSNPQQPPLWSAPLPPQSFPRPAYDPNTVAGNYRTESWFQGGNQQPPPEYQQYNFHTYPSQQPTNSNSFQYTSNPMINYPYQPRDSLEVSYPHSAPKEDPPFKYSHVPGEDLLVLAGKKSKPRKRKESSQPERIPAAEINFRPLVHYSLSSPSKNYVAHKGNPNLVTLVLDSSEPAKADDGNKCANKTYKNYTEKEKPSTTSAPEQSREGRKGGHTHRMDRNQGRNAMSEDKDFSEICLSSEDESPTKFEKLSIRDKPSSYRSPKRKSHEDESCIRDKGYYEKNLNSYKKQKTFVDHNEKRSNRTPERLKQNETDVTEIDSKEKKVEAEELLISENKLTLKHFFCDIGPEVRAIQEKSPLYCGIIESLKKGDKSYRRLYIFKNQVLCKIEKGLKNYKVVVPRDHLKDLVVIIHNKFHDFSQEDVFKSLKESIYPHILHINKCVSRVFSECAVCKLQPPKVEPLREKKVEKKSSNKTDKNSKVDKSKSPVGIKRTDVSNKKREGMSYSSSRLKIYFDRGRRRSDSKELSLPSYEKSTKSRVIPSKEKNQPSEIVGEYTVIDEVLEENFTNTALPSKQHDLEETHSVPMGRKEDSGTEMQAESYTETALESKKTAEPKQDDLVQTNSLSIKGKEEPGTELKGKNSTETTLEYKLVPASTKDVLEQTDSVPVEGKEEPRNNSGSSNNKVKPTEKEIKKTVPELDFKTRVRNVQMKELSEVISSVESGNNSEKKYLLKGGMLCEKSQSGSGLEVKIVAPPSQVEELIHIIHTMSSTHTPCQKVIAFIIKHFTPIDDLKNKVDEFINKCSLCK